MNDTCHMSSGSPLPSQSPRPVLYMGPLQQHWAAEPRRHQRADGITQFHRQFSLRTFSLYTTRAYTRAEMPPLPQASLWSSLGPTIGSSWVPSPASHSWAMAVQKYQGLEFVVILCLEDYSTFSRRTCHCACSTISYITYCGSQSSLSACLDLESPRHTLSGLSLGVFSENYRSGGKAYRGYGQYHPTVWTSDGIK